MTKKPLREPLGRDHATRGLSVGSFLEVSIEKLVWGGSGLARTEFGVVFVDFAAPGDRLEVEVTELAKDYARARIHQILEASPRRTQAPCPVFGRCGGCDWQHLSISDQLTTKQDLLRELFSRKLSFSEIPELIPSPREWNYRNRIQLHIDSTGPYFHGKRSHNPVYVNHCPIAEIPLSEQISKLKAQPPGSPPRRQQLALESHLEALDEEVWSNEFAQVNSAQNERLQSEVLRCASGTPFSRFFDLYAGSGNFSFPLAEASPQATGVAVELNAASVRAGQKETQRRKWARTRLQFFAASVDSILPRLPIEPDSLILVDPPRAGLGKKVCEIFAKTKASSLLYISCNPTTLARDLEIIVRDSQWKIHRVLAFDMFPQTAHLEVLVELRPSASPL